MANYRTAMGKVVDMSTLQAKNEKTRAVGNMKVNARGDTIDSHGRIIAPITAKVSDAYAKTVGNRSSHVTKKPVEKLQADAPVAPIIDMSQLTSAELELEESMEDDIEVEKIKAAEVKATQSKKK